MNRPHPGAARHRARHLRLHRRRGVAAVEFAIVAPALLAVLGAATDFGRALAISTQLQQAALAGATYAFAAQQEAGVSGTISASAVQQVVQANLSLSPAATVTVSGPSAQCTSTSGSTTTLTSGTAGVDCANGSLPNTYVVITVHYAFTPMMPAYSMLASTTLSVTSNVVLY